MYPDCDIPVIQISSAVGSTEDEWVENLLEMGKLLAPLRKEGVLFIGSGSATHNLQDFFIHGISNKPANWATDFVDFLKKMVKDKPLIGDLLKHKNLRKAHPTIDHLVPIAFCIGAAEEDDGKVIHEDWFGSLSLMCSQWG
jgi:4,5-DOPA dioxygenase extradiol